MIIITFPRSSKWTSKTAPFSLEIVRCDARSVGDVMRHLDHTQRIVGDFLCVYGDVVANIPLDAALAAHRSRRIKSKNAIMTMVLREAGHALHRTISAQSGHVRPTFVIDPSIARCVQYEEIAHGKSNPSLEITEELLADHAQLEVREDLIDCGIDICTPEVLAQYTDNFDWQRARRGFLFGVLKDFETNNLTIHTHIIAEGYAARAKSLPAYDAVSKDVVSRWAYPLCPDANLISDQSFQLLKGNVYKESGVVLARSSEVPHRCVLGNATSVGNKTVITNSVIGRRCVIGDRVKIDGAYIWDDVQIGDDTTIEKAVVANGASIGQRCIIEPGTLLSYGVKIADGMTATQNRRITTRKRKRGYEEDEIVEAANDPKTVGESGVGYHMELDEDEEEAGASLLYGPQMADLSLEDEDAISQFSSDESEDDDVDTHIRRDSQRSGSFTSIGSDENGADAARHDFHHEAVNGIFDALAKGDDPDTMQLELRALTLGSNAAGKQVRRAVAVAYCKRIAHLIESSSSSPKSAKDAVTETIPPNKLLISANVKDVDEQAEFLLFLQTDLVHRPQGEKVLLFASNSLATLDLIEAEGFEAWWTDPKSSASSEMEAVRKETKALVDVLVGDDEDDDDDEEDDDDD